MYLALIIPFIICLWLSIRSLKSDDNLSLFSLFVWFFVSVCVSFLSFIVILIVCALIGSATYNVDLAVKDYQVYESHDVTLSIPDGKVVRPIVLGEEQPDKHRARVTEGNFVKEVYVSGDYSYLPCNWFTKLLFSSRLLDPQLPENRTQYELIKYSSSLKVILPR